jgi:hypothetical protein
MSDYLGSAWLPALAPSTAMKGDTRVVTTRAPGDPALIQVGSFVATVMQTQLNDAWLVLDPASSVTRPGTIDGTRDGVGVVRAVFYRDPKKGVFATPDLPCLFVYRAEGPKRYLRVAQNGHRRISTLAVMWVTSPVDESREKTDRFPFHNSVESSIYHALVYRRHPSWVTPADQRDVDGLKTAFATSLTTQTITSFNGALAGTEMVAARPVCMTNTAAAGAYSTARIYVTGTDEADNELTDWMEFSTLNGGETITTILRFKTVTSVVLPAMAAITGSMTIGYWDSPDVPRGSLVQRAAGFQKMDLKELRTMPFEIVRPQQEPVPLLGVEAQVEVHEDAFLDPTIHAESPYDIEAHIQRSDGETNFTSLEIEGSP